MTELDPPEVTLGGRQDVSTSIMNSLTTHDGQATPDGQLKFAEAQDAQLADLQAHSHRPLQQVLQKPGEQPATQAQHSQRTLLHEVLQKSRGARRSQCVLFRT